MLHNLLSFLPNLWASRQTSGNVVMLHSGRVGSTVVAKMLDHHPRLRWEGEIFEHLSQLKTLPRTVAQTFICGTSCPLSSSCASAAAKRIALDAATGLRQSITRISMDISTGWR